MSERIQINNKFKMIERYDFLSSIIYDSLDFMRRYDVVVDVPDAVVVRVSSCVVGDVVGDGCSSFLFLFSFFIDGWICLMVGWWRKMCSFFSVLIVDSSSYSGC
jgi:hypothetical protein